MADNYLEKKMEEHRQNSVSGYRKAHRPQPKISVGSYKINIDIKHVSVAVAQEQLRAAIVNCLCQAGCHVAFCSDNPKTDSRLAQACGARYYPMYSTSDMVADINRLWGTVDMLITDDYRFDDFYTCANKLVLINQGEYDINCHNDYASVICPYSSKFTQDHLANFCLYLCSEGSLFSSFNKIILNLSAQRT